MPTCSGLLTKRGTSIKTWHKRHFSLEGVNLIYYTSDGSEKKGEYVINSDTTVEEAHLKRNCFCLIQHGRTLYMAADSLPEKEMWMSCLYDAIEEARIIEISKRASFKKRELTRDLADMNDEGMGLERISEITDDTSFAMPSRGPVRAKSTRDMVEAVPKNKNPIFASFESKKIHFHIMNARNLFSKGTSDTFARITVGNDTQETVVIKRDLNPSWDETFSFEWHYSLRYAKIEVWDVGSYGMGERFLGVVYVPIIPISSMSQVGKWYKLGKRSSKSHVSGEVYIDAYCDECYDFYPQQILNTVQDLQDLRGHVSDPGVIVPQTDNTPMEEIEAGEKRLMGKFMMQFPPLETEHLEDICLSVTLKPTLERGNGNSPLFCDGILLLTNYRLIFVSNSRLMFNQNDFFTLDTDLTTAIPLTTVVACNACSDQDPHDVSAKVSHDGIAIITNDARAFTFLFYEDVEKDSDGNVRTNRHASADTLFTKSGEEKKTATLSNVSNSYRYLDANESPEGCPSKRFLATLERKGFNRLCELHSNINIHHALISTLQYDPNSKPKDDYDDPELDSGMLNWLKSLPRDLRDSYRSSFNDGWHIYDAKEEFKRMGLPDAQWRISTANSSFEICDTYPTLLAVPVAVNDAKLGLAALFRSRGRLPVLSWRHPQNFCALTRSSQPLVGMQKRQSTEDEALLTAINQAAQMSGEGLQTWTNIKGKISSPFVIFDARPKLNATANQAAGKGYEMSFAYKNCNVLFMNIDNIHVMRKSLDALEDHCRTPVSEDPNWYSQVEGSGWLVHCNRVLVAAARLVHCMCKEQLSVLVHCSDGWDRTAQLTSLSMLMMDPFYRTYIGFQILIEKEWVSFGHKFGDRLGWSDAGWNSQERSPVFMQFLDCVHQMIHQNPNIFEFNEDLLVFIMHQTQSAWFGNFLLNSDKDRKMLRLSDRTVSLWSYVLMNFGTFGNPHYKPSKSDVWVPVTSIRKTVLWEKWFLKWHDVVWRNEWNGKNEDFSEIHVAETPTDITAHSHVKQCYECDTNFTIFLRRDHCFNCGNVFCEKCLVSKPDVHGTAHLYCRNCFDVYQEAIDAQLSGISQNVLMSSRMTRRVLGSASNIPLASRKSVEPAQPEHHENGNARRNIVEELQQDALKPISKREWMKLDDNERNSYVEEEDTAQYVDVRLKSRVNQVPVEKKPSLLSNLTSMFSTSTPKSQATEDAWASGTRSSPVASAYKNSATSPPPSSPNPPKRFIPFSNEMMTKSSTTLISEERDSDPPPLAKKYSSKTNQVQSPAKDQVRRSNTGDVGKVEAGGDRDGMRHENSHSASRSSPKRQSSMPDERSNGKRSPSRSPARRMHSTGSDRASRSPSRSPSQSPHQSPRRVISTGSDRSNRSPTRSVSTQGSSDNLFDRGPKRKNSRESLMNGDVAPPPSDKQISILPPEDEAAKLLKKKSSSNRFDMYKKTSVDLSKSKNSMQTRKNSMEDSF